MSADAINVTQELEALVEKMYEKKPPNTKLTADVCLTVLQKKFEHKYANILNTAQVKSIVEKKLKQLEMPAKRTRDDSSSSGDDDDSDDSDASEDDESGDSDNSDEEEEDEEDEEVETSDDEENAAAGAVDNAEKAGAAAIDSDENTIQMYKFLKKCGAPITSVPAPPQKAVTTTASPALPTEVEGVQSEEKSDASSNGGAVAANDTACSLAASQPPAATADSSSDAMAKYRTEVLLPIFTEHSLDPNDLSRQARKVWQQKMEALELMKEAGVSNSGSGGELQFLDRFARSTRGQPDSLMTPEELTAKRIAEAKKASGNVKQAGSGLFDDE